MDAGGNLRQGMARMRGGQWASAQCVQKVEEMLSRAIVHQEDLLELLVIHSPEGASLDAHTGHMSCAADAISPPVLRALKAKLENSMDWCHLAHCCLREIVLHTSPPPPAATSQQPSPAGVTAGAGAMSQNPNGEAKLVNSSHRLKTPSPLSPLRVLLRKESLLPHPFTVQAPISSSSAGCRSGGAWSPMSLLFNEASQLPSAAQSGDDAPASAMSMLGPDVEQQQGQNFIRLPSLGMDSDWDMLAEAGPMSDLPPPPLPSGDTRTDPHQSASSCQLNIDGSHDGGGNLKDLADVEDGSNGANAAGRGHRSKSGLKCDVRKLSGCDSKPAVIFQELKPGIDTKKGIPDDGHRSWKKYGNKAIQNSNFCRGYYKCSVKECRAKKMVQPTDKDPSIFEVTYVGKHTCSSTLPRRNRSRGGGGAPAQVEVEVEEAEGHFGSGSSEEAASPDLLTTSMVTEKEGEDGGAAIAPRGGKKRAGGGLEVEESSGVTRGGSEEEKYWAAAGGGGLPLASKRGRVNAAAPAADNCSYLNNGTTSTTTTAFTGHGGEGEAAMDTYLYQTSRYHQAVYAFQEPLLWSDFMDGNLSPEDHKSMSVNSVSP